MGRFSVVDNGNANEMSTYLSYEVTRITTGPSLYSFLHLNLEPVTRDDELLWYCSKVPWRFYNDYFSENIENAGFYYGSDAKWTAMRDTTLYKMYYAFLLKILPRRWSRWAGILADRKLKRVLTLGNLTSLGRLLFYIVISQHFITLRLEERNYLCGFLVL